jgi:hypothetical protein
MTEPRPVRFGLHKGESNLGPQSTRSAMESGMTTHECLRDS